MPRLRRIGARRRGPALSETPGTDGKLALLAALPVFAPCSPRELVRLGRMTELARYDAGEALLREGGACDGWLVVASGAALVARDDEALGVLGPGAFCGERALSLGQPSDVSVIALVPVTAVYLSRDDFFALPHRFPQVAAYLLWALSARACLVPSTAARQARR